MFVNIWLFKKIINYIFCLFSQNEYLRKGKVAYIKFMFFIYKLLLL